MVTVNRRDIQIGERLGQGGIAQVYRATSTIAGLAGTFAYKELLPGMSSNEIVAVRRGFERSVELFTNLSLDDLAELDRLTSRPLATVVDDGTTVGVLLRLLAPTFYLPTRSGSRIRELQLLNASAEQQDALGIDTLTVDYTLARLSILAQVCNAIELLHRNELIFGDLNLRNVAVGVKPPRAMLLDCDGIASHSDASRVQPNTPFFVPPELVGGRQRLQDRQTDVYKLGLLIIRGLSQGRGTTQLSDPRRLETVLNSEGVRLVERATSTDRAARPAAADLQQCLEGTIVTHGRTVLPLTRVDTVAFISYRRTDTMHGANRLYHYIGNAMGRGAAFIDLNMMKGIDFVKAIEDAIANCRVLLAVIGPGWLTATDEQGLRLDNPNDFVRLEIETALRLGIPVLPVLLDTTSMPRVDKLPPSLAQLARISACTVRGDKFENDCADVVATIRQLMRLSPPRPPTPSIPSISGNAAYPSPERSGLTGLPDSFV